MESAADAVKLLAVVAGALHHGEKINETREKIDELICRQTGNYLPWPENRRQLVEIIHTTAWRAPFIEDTLRFKPGSVPKEVQATAKKWRASMSRRLENNEDDDEPEEAEKAALKSEVASLRRKVESLEADLAHATSVPVIDAETGAVTREPKRQRDDDVPPASGLKSLKAATDATAGAFVEIKREKEALEDRLLCTICMEADAPRTSSSGRATTTSPAPRAPPRSPSAPTVARQSRRARRSRIRAKRLLTSRILAGRARRPRSTLTVRSVGSATRGVDDEPVRESPHDTASTARKSAC